MYKQNEEIPYILEVGFKQTQQQDMEFAITIHPIMFVFQQRLVQRVVNYFKVPNLQLSDQAYDQLKSLQVGT